MSYWIDRKFRRPRVWSNKELKKLCKNFSGDIINVSGWQDSDKEKLKYQDYFKKIDNYYISNYESTFKGFQNNINEILLNLEDDINYDLINKFDVVFNHTALEHIFDFQKAFQNLCLMSKDIVIIVVPFIQEQHAENADYGDYWRFTPMAIKKMFQKNNLELLYLNYNDEKNSSIYIVALGSKKPESWNFLKSDIDNKITKIETTVIGKRIINNPFIVKFYNQIKVLIQYK